MRLLRRRRHGERRLGARRSVLGVSRRFVVDAFNVGGDADFPELNDGVSLDDVVDEAGFGSRGIVQT